MLFYPTAIGWHPSEKAEYGAAQHDAWRTIQRSHAIANGVYVAAVNRVGYEGPPEHGLEFWGGSFVADPFGQVLAEGTHDQEETLIVECDPRRIEEVRRNWPFLRDRRIDAYERDPEQGDSIEGGVAAGPRLPHAGGVGAARGHLDRLAAQSRGLARPLRADPVGLRRDRAQAGRGGACAHPGATIARCRSRRAAFFARVGADLDAVEFLPCPDQSRLDPRLRPDLRHESCRAKSALTQWRFNAWAKYDNWQARRARARRSWRGA